GLRDVPAEADRESRALVFLQPDVADEEPATREVGDGALHRGRVRRRQLLLRLILGAAGRQQRPNTRSNSQGSRGMARLVTRPMTMSGRRARDGGKAHWVSRCRCGGGAHGGRRRWSGGAAHLLRTCTRCSSSPLRRSTSDTHPLVRPTSCARSRVVQRLRRAGGSDRASSRRRSTVAAGTAWFVRPAFGRVANPATPVSRNRWRIRDTASADRCKRRAISAPAISSALHSTTCARRTSCAGAVACASSRSSSLRCSEVSTTSIAPPYHVL